MTIATARDLLQKAYLRWSEDNAPRLAASLAFYAMLSLAPLIVFAIAMASRFLDSGAVRQSLLHQAQIQLGRGASELVATMIDSGNKPGVSAVASVLALLLALLGASGLFEQLQASVSSIWKMAPRKGGVIGNFFIAKLGAVLMALIVVALILAWLGIDSVIGYMQSHSTTTVAFWPLISFLVSLAFLTGVFGIAFRALPRKMVRWSDVWFPAFVTAFGFGMAKFLLGLYFGLVGVGAAYGPAGALVVVLLWFYYSTQIFFFGVELTHVYCFDCGSHVGETEGDLQVS